MKVFKMAALSIIISALYISHLLAADNEWYGQANGQKFTITYKQDEKAIYYHIDNNRIKIPLSGYAIKEMHIKDVNYDGNDEFFFLDLSGESVGGELRFFYWDNGRPTEINEEHFANKLTFKQHDRKLYILLWQHDIDDLLYCSEVLLFKDGKLIKEITQNVWNEIIADYEKLAATEKIKWRKARFYSYMALAYKKIGNITKSYQYFSKAKTLDPKNPLGNVLSDRP